jgi:hypothetical protein
MIRLPVVEPRGDTPSLDNELARAEREETGGRVMADLDHLRVNDTWPIAGTVLRVTAAGAPRCGRMTR